MNKKIPNKTKNFSAGDSNCNGICW